MTSKKLANIAIWFMGIGLFLLCVPDWMRQLGLVYHSIFTVISVVAWVSVGVGFILASRSFFIPEENR